MSKNVKVILAAALIFIVFLAGAGYIYAEYYTAKSGAQAAFLLKVADTLINGAIVGVLLAVLRWWFDIPKLVAAADRLDSRP